MLHRRYRFQPQDHGFDPGDEVFATGTGKAAGTIVSIDDAGGIDRAQALAQLGVAAPARPSSGRRHSRAAPRSRRCCASPTRSSRTASTATAPTGRSATCSCASRRAASVGWGAPLVEPGEDVLDAARRLALELDAGTLPIQGPPGTGKTYAGARMILDLVRAGEARRRHGAVPQDHQQPPRGRRRGGDARRTSPSAIHPEGATPTSATIAGRDPGRAPTPTSRPRWPPGPSTSSPGPAGSSRDPSSTAPSTSCSSTRRARCRSPTRSRSGTCARSIVLIGDPNQLPMVTQGVHPGGPPRRRSSTSSATPTTIPPERGLFLETSRRMHPDVNAFISPAFYDGRLETHPGTARPRRRRRRPRPVRLRGPLAADAAHRQRATLARGGRGRRRGRRRRCSG